MSIFAGYLVALLVVTCLMTSLWISSVFLSDVSIIDRFWGLGFVLISWTLFLLSDVTSIDSTVLVALVSIWGIRLSIHIHLRNRGSAEDFRYQEMRRRDPDQFWWKSYIRVFLLQGMLMLIICAPIVTLLVSSTEGPSYWSIMGFLLWAVGFFFEAVGDLQLKKFKQNPLNKGKLLTTGLWSLTRHPNYFGDACQWWGFGLFAFTIQPYGYLSFLGPAFMTILIIKVSGVDLLEKSMADSKPGYREYIKNVPSFIPRFPFRKKTS